MQHSTLRFTFLGLALSSTLVACGGDDTVGLGVSARTGTAAPVAEDARGTAFTLEQGLLHLRHVELELPAGTTCADIAGTLVGARCESGDSPGDEGKIRIDGPFAVDMISGESQPSLAAIAIPPGTYRRIDLRVDDGDPQEGLIEPGSPLDDNSLVVVASFDDGGTPATLDLRLNFDEDIRIEHAGGVAVAPGDDLIARFAASNWLSAVDLGACIDTLPASGGRYVIDDRNDGACGGIEDTVKSSMKNSGDLVDSDDD